MKPPHSLTDDQLKAYADEHLQYEFDMLTWSAAILGFLAAFRESGALPWAINNGLLNTFAIHARNLIDFLYSRSRGKDRASDVIVEDYIQEDTLPGLLPTMSPLLEETLTKANKQVAHLTKERVEYGRSGKEWKFIEVAKEIRNAFAAIAPHLPASKVSDALRRKLLQRNVEIPVVDILLKNDHRGRPIGVCLSLRATPAGDAIDCWFRRFIRGRLTSRPLGRSVHIPL